MPDQAAHSPRQTAEIPLDMGCIARISDKPVLRPVGVLEPSDRPPPRLDVRMAGAGAAFDGGGGQPADLQMVADHLEDAGLLLRHLAVGGGDVAGQRIGGLAQLLRQRRP